MKNRKITERHILAQMRASYTALKQQYLCELQCINAKLQEINKEMEENKNE